MFYHFYYQKFNVNNTAEITTCIKIWKNYIDRTGEGRRLKMAWNYETAERRVRGGMRK
jgi:hypothetical protein